MPLSLPSIPDTVRLQKQVAEQFKLLTFPLLLLSELKDASVCVLIGYPYTIIIYKGADSFANTDAGRRDVVKSVFVFISYKVKNIVTYIKIFVQNHHKIQNFKFGQINKRNYKNIHT